jgi:hypothetical protein
VHVAIIELLHIWGGHYHLPGNLFTSYPTK